MKKSLISSLLRNTQKLALLASVPAIVSLSSCSGGGGSDSSMDNEPAPQTLDGITMQVWSGGPILSFTRASGDAVGSAEIGAISMVPNPIARAIVDTNGGSQVLLPAATLSGARYSYTRIDSRTGRIILTGESVAPPIIAAFSYFYTRGGSGTFSDTFFERTYEVTFASQGGIISGISLIDRNTNSITVPNGTGVTVVDGREEFARPTIVGIVSNTQELNIFQNDALVRLTAAAGQTISVPIGYNLDRVDRSLAPPLYLISVQRQQLIITPDTTFDPDVAYNLLDSDFTPELGEDETFVERGTGNCFAGGDFSTTPTSVSFAYDPIEGSVTDAILTVRGSNPTVDIVYELRFLDRENGVFQTQDNPPVRGVFRFPFGEDL